MAEPSSPPSSANFLTFDKLGFGAMAYAYAVLMGAAYLLAFWRPFGFEIFSYLKLGDYVAAPLGRLSVLLASPVLLAAVIYGDANWRNRHGPDLAGYLGFMYLITTTKDLWGAVTTFADQKFYFDNEVTILMTAGFLTFGSFWLYLQGFRKDRLAPAVLGLVLIQLAAVLSAGYVDGKRIFAGASNVMFLDNKDLCEPGGVRDWVHVASFGERVFFVNTIDKRICIRESKDLMLRSRKFSEKL